MSGVPGPVRASGGHVGPPRLPIKAEALIPHRPPMLLIEALVRCEGGSALVAAAIPAGHPAAPDGRISEAAMVECVAQATAAMKGFESIGSGGPGGIGMLAGVSEFEILDVPPAGARAEVEVREEKRMGALALVSGEVRVEGRTVARGRIKVYAGG